MAINTSLLSEICTTPGAPGFEQKVRELVIKQVTPLVDEVELDNMGNVYAIKRGTGDKKVMIGAHMDEIGFIVTHIDDNGFIRFHTLGGFDPENTDCTARYSSRKERHYWSNGFKAYPCNDTRRAK